MTLIELVSILKTTGLPLAYHHFDDPPALPYMIYLEDGTSNVIADNKVYKKVMNIRIELYTNKKDLAAEKTLEDVLNENELPFDADETYIESERLFQRIYEIGVI